jgi:hypothetical protein
MKFILSIGFIALLIFAFFYFNSHSTIEDVKGSKLSENQNIQGLGQDDIVQQENKMWLSSDSYTVQPGMMSSKFYELQM